ncbi:MAG: DUF4114 domain-containing protein [Cyanothece sp. SIO2G6]|nr:DUF4114 domain-containing protein [Cyanothece sp. SIO2G6]
MKKTPIAIILGCFSGLVLPGLPAFADTSTHFGDGFGSDVPSLLDDVGIGSQNAASETTATTFLVPGAPGSTTDFDFEFLRDTGGFQFSFGFFEVDQDLSGFDPVLNKEAWALEALADATLVFDDRVNDPGDVSNTFSLDSGSEIGFFLIPNNTLANFQGSPSSFFPSQTSVSSLRSPLFSVSDANPGEFDQMLSFVDAGVTLFTFEDLTRTGISDQDFTDLSFVVNAELRPVEQPIPEPSSWLGMFSIVSLAAFFYKRT